MFCTTPLTRNSPGECGLEIAHQRGILQLYTAIVGRVFTQREPAVQFHAVYRAEGAVFVHDAIGPLGEVRGIFRSPQSRRFPAPSNRRPWSSKPCVSS
jgi:hypothetical protein